MFSSDSEGRDLMLLGTLTARDGQGSTTKTDFAARISLEEDHQQRPRMKIYQAFVGKATKGKSAPDQCVVYQQLLTKTLRFVLKSDNHVILSIEYILLALMEN